MIHLYCVVDDGPAALDSRRQHGPEGMVVVDIGPMACVGRAGPTAPPSDDPQALLDHDAVIRRLMGVCTVMPFRYGTVLATEHDVRAQMALRAEELQLLLPRLKGKVELALRASCTLPPRRCSSSGRGYLRSLRHQSGSSSLHRLHSTLAASSDAAVLAADRPCSIKSAYLVNEDGVDGFCGLLARTLTDLEGTRDVSLTGPWAPYSFVGAPTGSVTERQGQGAFDA